MFVDIIVKSCLSVCPQISNFSNKGGFESKDYDLSIVTKLTLLDSLLQEVTAGQIRIATCPI